MTCKDCMHYDICLAWFRTCQLKNEEKYTTTPCEFFEKREKCVTPGRVTIKPDGVHELDPCVYELKEIHDNVTVYVHECKNCGHVDISWSRTDDTEDIECEE